MTTRPARHRRLRLLALVVAAALLAACSGSDDGDTANTGTTDTTAPSTSAGEGGGDGPGAESPYGDHTSEVYEDDANWICRPDLADDECRDLDVTVIGADGSRTVEEREPAADPPIDCFYIYPTVSADPAPNADLEWAPEDNEALTVVAQAAQFARSCRVFAPVYRQVPLAGLSEGFSGRDVAYADVLDAWKTYITRWNDGRGVIVMGHSQGMGHLADLLAEEVDDEPALRERLVAAYLFGGAVRAPEGSDVGGSYDEIPACRATDQTGCLVTWSSWPRDEPPPAGALFGTSGDDGRALCVDAVALLGREHAHPVAPVDAPLVGGIPGTEDVETPFVAVPEALDVSCEATADHDYLAVAKADPADARPLDGFQQSLSPEWGLHLVDVNVALDDLVELARLQAEAYTDD